jgi:DNA-binding LytR/AlgR family response regulator
VPSRATIGHHGDPVPAPRAALHCLVVDDQPTTLTQLAQMLRTHSCVATVRTAADAAEALRTLGDAKVDAAFIEPCMRDMDGMELAGILKRFRAAPEVVFVTRHPERAADAFDLGAVDYLSKPPRPDRLAESLRRVTAIRHATPAARSTGDMAIPVQMGGTTKIVWRSSVRWVQARGDYARLHTANGSHLIRARLTALADSWRDAGLIRIHRSHLVQLRFVTDVRETQPGQLTVVVDGHHLPVSRRAARTLRSQLFTAAGAAACAVRKPIRGL